ncbi:MAG: cation:proton antiporter [Acidobacteriaceae bacterium]
MSAQSLFILQLAVIVTVAGLCGGLVQKLGQPRVVGEMIGGILLGRSVMGAWAPHFKHTLFPAASLHTLELVSNLGLVLYLFLEGLDLDVAAVWKQRSTALRVSTISMGAPLALGLLLALCMHRGYSGTNTGLLSFLLFFGTAISTTAFPVLARILREHPVQGDLGPTTLVTAAIADVLGWTLLAVALTVVSAGSSVKTLALRLLLLLVYIVVLLGAFRPLAGKLVAWRGAPRFSRLLLGVFLVGALLSAFATERLGVHALFGAFLAGICLPRVPHWKQQLEQSVSPLVSILLLPVFFAVTGMNAEFKELAHLHIALWTVLILVVAIAGKIGGTYYAARKASMNEDDALSMGVLMNTRGLVELVVLNIAYDAGIFNRQLFTAFVLMALVTTVLTAPLLQYVQRRAARHPVVAPC